MFTVLSIIVVVGIYYYFIKDGLDPKGAWKNVCELYPDADVKNVPNRNYSFLVKTSEGDIRLVKCDNLTNVNIASDVIMFKGD